MRSMFTNSYEMTRALVAERQETLRHEARQHRLRSGARRVSRSAGDQQRDPPGGAGGLGAVRRGAERRCAA